MHQTRTFLIFAWLMVATLLWLAWNREHAPAPAPTATSVAQGQAVDAADSTVPATPTPGAAPAATMQATTGSAHAPQPTISVTTDVLRLRLDGGAIHDARLLRFPQTTAPGSPPMQLFSDAPAQFYEAQSGWVSAAGAAPNHEAGFLPESPQQDYVLAPGAKQVSVPFVWHGPGGVSIRRTYTFTRGDYVVQVRDEVSNAGSAPWQGAVYRQLLRVPPQVASGMTHPESYSFHGAAWFAGGSYDKRKFSKYEKGPQLEQSATGGWIAMLQHHFFAAWIPAPDAKSTFTTALARGAGGQQALIREYGPTLSVAPGASASTQARLWVGPKLVKQIQAQHVQGLERAVDFSSFAWLAWIAGLLFAVLSFLHGLIGNWGWAIIGLVLIVKALMYPLSAAQYKSAAKMRRFQPRIEQLKERYGDDKQKFQMALMELYKKEKLNPVGGCLPVLLQAPVFFALYYTLLESVELRQAPWIGWIHNLTAPDPYFILPAINVAVMFATQRLTPAPPGMDPMQRKLMQVMPLGMGVMFAFFPAGLVLYWVTNGSLGLLQQWWMTRRYGQPASTHA